MFGTPSDDSPRGRRDPLASRKTPATGSVERPSRRAGRNAVTVTAATDADASSRAPVHVVPVRRLLSLTIAGFSLMLGFGLIMGAQTSGPDAQRIPFAVVIFASQVLYVLATTTAMRPPGAKIVAIVGILTAIAANVAANYPDIARLGPLGLVAAAGFVAGLVGQLIRREGRTRVTESMGATLVVVLGVVSFATLLVLTRIPAGTQAIVVCLAAGSAALSVARLSDVIAPWPRLADQVPRGSIGIVLGAMIGTGLAGFIGSYIEGFNPSSAAIVGACCAGAAVLGDLTIGFAEAGRELAGDAPTMWLARHMQGPLAGFAMSAPVAYIISVFFLSPG